jgi:hypothetical protein
MKAKQCKIDRLFPNFFVYEMSGIIAEYEKFSFKLVSIENMIRASDKNMFD